MMDANADLVVPAALAPRPTGQRCSCPVMKDWSRRSTLAETTGGASDLGTDSVGLAGQIAVQFNQGDNVIKTVATAGQPLSSVAAQAGQVIRYKCRKGECGTCAVRIDGQWVRTCVARVPQLEAGKLYNITVRPSMANSKKSSAFFSFKSFIAGAKNNILGMVGFVKEGFGSNEKSKFDDRISWEDDLDNRVKIRKAAKIAAAKELGISLEEYQKKLRDREVTLDAGLGLQVESTSR